jgi:MoaA/NifB/PqqE/SkfB family radical SAM enzyme
MSVLPRDLSLEARRNAATKTWRPRNAVWELTLACNLRCVHCGSRAGASRADELSTAECLDVVAQLADLGGELLTLSGGEPLLRDDWDVIAREAARRGLTVNLVTNGTLVDARIAGRARAAGLANVGVSIDGPRDVHDAIRGRGAFDNAVRGIGCLRDAGISVALLTTVHRRNLGWLDSTRRLAIDLGAHQWRLQLGKPMGAMKDHDDLVLQPRQIPGLIDAIVRMKAAGGISVSVGDSIGYCGPGDRALRGWGWRGRNEAWHGCQAGLQAIGIESDGGIKGCLSLQAREGDLDPFREGGVRQASLAEWWFRDGAFAYNRDFDVAGLSGACRQCRHAARCRGGARCVAAAFTGALSEDPYCETRVRALEARPGVRERLAMGAAAAAAAMVMGLPGCDVGKDGDLEPDAMVDVPSIDPGGEDLLSIDPGPADLPPSDPGADAIDCDAVCCMCDYGVIPSEVYEACCVAPDVPPTDPGAADVPVPDATQDAVDCAALPCLSDPDAIPLADFQACCVDPCTPPPCCECDYGFPPPPQCCQ